MLKSIRVINFAMFVHGYIKSIRQVNYSKLNTHVFVRSTILQIILITLQTHICILSSYHYIDEINIQ